MAYTDKTKQLVPLTKKILETHIAKPMYTYNKELKKEKVVVFVNKKNYIYIRSHEKDIYLGNLDKFTESTNIFTYAD